MPLSIYIDGLYADMSLKRAAFVKGVGRIRYIICV